jgi:hypothetical protein
MASGSPVSDEGIAEMRIACLAARGNESRRSGWAVECLHYALNLPTSAASIERDYHAYFRDETTTRRA